MERREERNKGVKEQQGKTNIMEERTYNVKKENISTE